MGNAVVLSCIKWLEQTTCPAQLEDMLCKIRQLSHLVAGHSQMCSATVSQAVLFHTNGCILVGLRTEPMPETGMRLTPGERQSGDGTSLPETPNNLTNVRTTEHPHRSSNYQPRQEISLWFLFYVYKLSAVYAELENMYSAKRSKSLKTRPPPAPESLLDLDPPSCTDSPTMHANAGS